MEKTALTPEKLLQPRIKIIAPWPYMPKARKVGEIIQVTKEKLQWWLKFSSNVKELSWWEDRPIEVMQNINYVKIITYRGYWRVGDIVPVIGFEIGSIDNAKPYGYNLKYKHWQPVYELAPATETEYLTYQNSIK